MSLSIRLPEDIEMRLEKLAARTGRSKTFYIREAILDHLKDLEDLYLAEREYAKIKSGRAKTIPLEEVMEQYGMEG